MKHSTKRTIFSAAAMVVFSCVLLWCCLTIFGSYDTAISKQPQDLPMFNTATLPQITQQDYELYPILDVNNFYDPSVLQDYMITPKDAAVLACKQIKELLGYNLDGYVSSMQYTAPGVPQWEGYCTAPDDTPLSEIAYPYSYGYYYAVDAVTGALTAFCSFSESSQAGDVYALDEEACIEKAISIVRKCFPDLPETVEVTSTGYCYSGLPFGYNTLFCVRMRTGTDRVSNIFFSRGDHTAAVIDLQGYYGAYGGYSLEEVIAEDRASAGGYAKQ